jgi:hypothetical protein
MLNLHELEKEVEDADEIFTTQNPGHGWFLLARVAVRALLHIAQYIEYIHHWITEKKP